MQFRGLMVLIVVCLVSLLGLVSLAVPQPTTVTFTSTQPVTATGSKSFEVLVTPVTVLSVTSYPCFGFAGFAPACYTVYVVSVADYSQIYGYAAASYTTTALYPFTYVNFFAVTTNVTCNLIGCAWETYTTWATYTYSPAISTSTSMTTSTVTSSLTQTAYSTEQLSPILTSSTNQMIAAALAVVLVVSLLTVVRVLRKKEAKQATLTQFTKP